VKEAEERQSTDNGKVLSEGDKANSNLERVVNVRQIMPNTNA
jgi:hypothetical protein